MSWSFEQYRITNRTDLITPVETYDKIMCWGGRDIFTSTHFTSIDNDLFSRIYIYSFFDRANDYEGLSEHYYFDNNQVPLNLVHVIGELDPISGIVKFMTYWDGFVYVVVVNSDYEIYKINTNTYEIDLLYTANEPIIGFCSANNKLWIGLHSLDQDRNRMLIYNLLDDTTTIIALPGKKQGTPRKMVDGLKGWLYVTARNEHSIIRINTTTNNVDGIHLVNRHPYSLGVTQDQNIWIVSDVTTSVPAASTEELTVTAESTGTNEYTTSSIKPKETTPVQMTGMLQKMNQTTFDITNFGAAGGQLESVLIDEEQDHIWHIGGLVTIARTKISNRQYRFKNAKSEGFNIDIPFIPAIGLITPKLTYDRWNGTDIDQITVRPYLFFFNGTSQLVGIRLNSMIRKNYYKVRGTGMIATGEQKYYGE